MREYIVTGFVVYQDRVTLPFTHGMLLEADEVMDLAKFKEIEQQLAPHVRDTYHGAAASFSLTGFQAMEPQRPNSDPIPEDGRIKQLDDMVAKAHELRKVLGSFDPHLGYGDPIEKATHVLKQLSGGTEFVQLNECGTVLPPVDSPLVIEIQPGVMVGASRISHVERRGDQLVFDLAHGGQFVGRPRWTHR